jgi:sugar phosphate isomerase/epimerase
MGTVVQTAAEIDRVMEGTDDVVGLLLDTGHATWGGDDPVRLAKTYRSRIRHVHCKDVREKVRTESEKKDLSFLDSVLAGVYTIPGDGAVDYVSTFKALKGYSGWVVVEAEQDPSIANPLVYATKGHQNMTRLLTEGGLV